ncbi:Cutinase transcription factor 1 alpha [Sphaceloma murrayae]|uniref:Cutinase transcription factor 1 alpha n=1 Tax=Sphaceloma murrayae TaxID=2082308 RepID=A0A2K1R2M1_9PEZI|nr:Cutinase transcription factor 1 alpha [Sphaceloma murrayae]
MSVVDERCDVTLSKYKAITRSDWPTPKRRRQSHHLRSEASETAEWEQRAGGNAVLPLTPSASTSFERGTSGDHADTSAGPQDDSELARTGLSRFFERGIRSQDWRAFGAADNFRLAYVGTPTANLAHLVRLRMMHEAAAEVPYQDVHMQPSSNVQPSPDNRTVSEDSISPYDSRNTDRESNAGQQPWALPLHFPYPQIRPMRPWRPDGRLVQQSSQSLITDLSSFPAREVRQALIDAYFDKIHPLFPVVTKTAFMHATNKHTELPPLLLYQAVLLAGAHVCSHPLVVAERQKVKSVLFRRASMLFHLRHETDRLQLTQAALLFTWHINDGDTVSGGPWYWTGVAMRISCGQGTHRRNDPLPIFEHVIHRRTFWTTFILEVFSSLETGRPCSIRSEDIDQVPFTQADLDWEPTRASGSPHVTETAPATASLATAVPLQYHLRMIELAYIGLEILHLNAPSGPANSSTYSIDNKLASWLLRTEAVSLEMNEHAQVLLRLHYHLIILHLHRNINNEAVSSTTCQSAAQTIVSCLERLLGIGSLGWCHFTVVSAATAAGIQIVQEVRYAVINNTLLAALSLLDQLKRMLGCLDVLGKHWPNAEAVSKVLDGLHKDYQQAISQKLDHSEVALPDPQPDWDSLFASMSGPGTSELQNEQDWMNLANWTDLS